MAAEKGQDMRRRKVLIPWLCGCGLGILACIPPAHAELPQQWPDLEAALNSRKTEDTVWERRRMWPYLAAYFRTQLESGANEAGQQEILTWAAHLARHDKPLLLKEPHSLAATRQIGSVRWQAVNKDTYRLCLLPVPGQLLLFGYPDRDLGDPRMISELHMAQLSPQQRRSYLESVAYKKIQEEAKRMGHRRWPFLLIRLMPEPASARDQVPTISLENDRIAVRWGEVTTTIRLPDDEQLGRQIGLALDPSEIPPPGGRTLYYALDWSTYMASPARRGWLIKQLQSSLDCIPEHWLVQRSIQIHSGRQRVDWPLSQLRDNLMPKTLPTPHRRETYTTLASAIRAANQAEGDHRLVFMTFNGGLTSDPSDRPLLAVHRQQAGQARLRVIQVHGDPVAAFEELAGRSRYDIVDFEPDTSSCRFQLFD